MRPRSIFAHEPRASSLPLSAGVIDPILLLSNPILSHHIISYHILHTPILTADAGRHVALGADGAPGHTRGVVHLLRGVGARCVWWS